MAIVMVLRSRSPTTWSLGLFPSRSRCTSDSRKLFRVRSSWFSRLNSSTSLSIWVSINRSVWCRSSSARPLTNANFPKCSVSWSREALSGTHGSTIRGSPAGKRPGAPSAPILGVGSMTGVSSTCGGGWGGSSSTTTYSVSGASRIGGCTINLLTKSFCRKGRACGGSSEPRAKGGQAPGSTNFTLHTICPRSGSVQNHPMSPQPWASVTCLQSPSCEGVLSPHRSYGHKNRGIFLTWMCCQCINSWCWSTWNGQPSAKHTNRVRLTPAG